MKVLHVQRASGISGSERHLLALLPALAERGVAVRVALAVLRDGDWFAAALRDRGLDVVVWPARRHADPRLAAAVAREARRFRADLVHTHLIDADLYGQLGAALARVPGVSTAHSTHGFLARRPYRYAATFSGRLARRTIAVSDAVRRFVVESRLVAADCVRVVHHGIDVAEWASDRSREEARRRFSLQPDEVAIGVASRLVEGKGHGTVIEATAAAHARAPNVRLLVAGDGPLRQSLEAQAGARLAGDVVRFLGFVPDMRAFMAACDIVVFPSSASFGEGFGMAALEAMAAGRPVVATAVGPLPEVVDHGATGLLVDPDDVASLTAALLVTAADDDLRIRMGRAARARAATSFGLDTMVEGTLSVYREALAGGPAPSGNP